LKKPIAIVGAGGLGREVLTVLNALLDWETTGFYDDKITKGDIIKLLPVLGTLDDLRQVREPTYVVLAVGDALVKKKIIQLLDGNSNIHYPALIHPRALIQEIASVKLGKGTIISAGAILTADIVIGEHVLINISCTIGHGTSIGNGCSIMPGVNIAGDVTIGTHTLIGSGANILGGVKIGSHARVGSGAVVTKDVKANATVVGIPAREIS
jgi:sugar O-acyltransferase (sialic acid O-acetyltransferase NeuD family)